MDTGRWTFDWFENDPARYDIFTEADTWEELRANVLEAVSLHFEDATARPRSVPMYYVKDELLAVEAA